MIGPPYYVTVLEIKVRYNLRSQNNLDTSGRCDSLDQTPGFV